MGRSPRKERTVTEDRTQEDSPSVVGDGTTRLTLLATLFALAAAIALAGVPEQALAQGTAEEGEARVKEKAASLDCSDFATQKGAQAILARSPVASAGDPFELDEDGDGEACEAGPGGTAEDGTGLGAETGGDLDCWDLSSQATAQARLKADPSDPHKFDPENNGVACEFSAVPYADRALDSAPVAAARSEADLDCKDFEYQQEAQAAYDRDPGDPNGLDGPNEKAEKDERSVGNGFPCETMPVLASNVESIVAKTEGAKAVTPAALIAAWPHGGGLGFVLDLAALLLVASGVSALLLFVRRARRSPSGSGGQ